MKVASLVDIATRHIEELIVTGKLKPGAQIKEDDVAQSLGISRPPVREALNCLEGEGLVVRKPRKGAFVIEMTDRDIWEVYTLKAELYAMALGYAMDIMTDGQVRELQSLVNRMNEITQTEPDNILKFQKLHRKFHKKIMEIADNQRLLKFALSLHKQIRRYSFQTLMHEEHLLGSNRYHQQIMERITENDRETACRLMKEHVLSGMNFLLDRLEILDNHDGVLENGSAVPG